MNRLFLVAITGECSLLVLHGITPRYNPFTLLRKEAEREDVVLPKSRLKCLLWLRQMLKDNGLTEHKLLSLAIEKLSPVNTES